MAQRLPLNKQLLQVDPQAEVKTSPSASSEESRLLSEQEPTKKESSDGEGTIVESTGGDVLPPTGDSGIPPASTGVPSGESGDAAVLTGVAIQGDSDNLDGAGVDGFSPTATVNSNYWPVVYDYEGMVMLSYAGLPQGGDLIVEITQSMSVEEIIAIARSYGFSAKSILNHMVDCGYQFKGEEDSNQFYSLDY